MKTERDDGSSTNYSKRTSAIWWSIGPSTSSEAGGFRHDLTPELDMMDALRSKTQAAANPVHSFTIWNISLVTDHRCKPLVEHCCSFAHSTCCWHHNWCECSMFNFLYMLLILSFFSCLCLLYTNAKGPCRFDWTLGLNTLTSKNAYLNLPLQKPYKEMS